MKAVGLEFSGWQTSVDRKAIRPKIAINYFNDVNIASFRCLLAYLLCLLGILEAERGADKYSPECGRAERSRRCTKLFDWL